MLRSAKLGCLLAVVLQLNACSLFQGPKPDVTIADVKIGDVTVFETNADFVIRITNRSDKPLSIDGAAHDIYLNDLHIGTGTSDEKIVVPRLGSATQHVSVHISNLTLVRRMHELINAKKFDYHVESTFYSGSGIFNRMTTEQDGSVSVEEFSSPTDNVQTL